MHRVSDHLQDRHPYLDLGFTESYDAKEVHRAFGDRAIAKYAELLVLDDLLDEDRARALADLRELLSNQETKFQAVDRELVFACAGLTDSPSLDVRVNAALAIALLVLYSSDRSDSDELSTEATLRAATGLLSDAEEAAVVAGCAILRNLTLSTEGALLVASRLEVVAKITSMVNSQPLKTLPEAVVGAVLGVVANVTRVVEGAQACAECAVTSPVLGVLKKCALFDAETVLSAARIVLHAGTHDQGKRLAIHQGGVELCLKVLARVLAVAPPGTFQKCDKTLHVELTRCLVGAVMTLSTVEDAKPRIVEFGVEPLVTCLHHESRAVRDNAGVAINSACEAPRGVRAFTDALLAETDLLVRVLGAKSIPALLRYLDGDDGDATLDALAAMQTLVRESEVAAHAVVQTLRLVDALVELALRTANDAATTAAVDKAVSVLLLTVAHGDKFLRRVGRALAKHGASAHTFALITSVDMATFQLE